MMSTGKKWFALLLALTLCIGMLPAQAEVVSGVANALAVVVSAEEDAVYLQSVAKLGDRVFGLNGSTLYELDTQTPNKFKAGYEMQLPEGMEYANCSALVADAERLYAFEIQKRAVYPITVTGDSATIGEPVGALPEPENPDEYWHTSDMTLVDGAIYLLMPNPQEYERKELWEIKLADGAARSLGEGYWSGLTAYKPGMLMVREWDSMRYYQGEEELKPVLRSLNVATGEWADLLTLEDTDLQNFCYDATSDTIYSCTDSLLYRWVGLGAMEKCAYLSLQGVYSDTKMVPMQGKMYITDNAGGYAISETDPAKMPERALVIASYFKDDLIARFGKAHPEIPVVVTGEQPYTTEQIAQNMTAGSDSADIYCMDMSGGIFSRLREKGYCVDLSSSQTLMDAIARMNPGYVKELTADGKLWGFPYQANASCLGYSPSALEKLGLTEDDLPHTLSEFMDFAVTWVNEYEGEYADLALMENVYDIRSQLFSMVLEGYLRYASLQEGIVEIDTPLLQKLLTKLDEVSDRLKELNADDAMMGGVMVIGGEETAPALFNLYQSCTPQGWTMYDYKPLPLALDEGMDPIIPMNMQVYLVNPNSANKDMAITFLEFVAQNMEDGSRITLYSDDNEPVVDPYAEKSIADVKKEIEELEKKLAEAPEEEKREYEDMIASDREYLEMWEAEKYLISAEDIAQYRELEPYMHVISTDVLSSMTAEGAKLIERYVGGEMNAQQFTRELGRILRMIQMEDQ